MGNANNICFGSKNCKGAKRRSFNHASANSFRGAIRWDGGHLVPAVFEDLAEEAEEGEDGDVREHEGEGAEDEGVQVGGRALPGRNLGVEAPGGEPGGGGRRSQHGNGDTEEANKGPFETVKAAGWINWVGWFTHGTGFRSLLAVFSPTFSLGEGKGSEARKELLTKQDRRVDLTKSKLKSGWDLRAGKDLQLPAPSSQLAARKGERGGEGLTHRKGS